MIRIERSSALVRIVSSVTEFSESIGYCQYKIPFFIEGKKATPNISMVMGSTAHSLAEIKEKSQFAVIPMRASELLNSKFDFEFPREGVYTRLHRKCVIEDQKVEILLCGRTDKLKRIKGQLILQEDKSATNVKTYLTRIEPYPNQILQVLSYLNSKFTQDEFSGPDGWFAVKHAKRKWIIRIMSISGNTVKIFQGDCNSVSDSYLESSLEKFAKLLLGVEKFTHHNRAELCKHCAFYDQCAHKVT